jgi:prevent-host-death family protein
MVADQHGRDLDRVGVRELRQNLSVYLRRVRRGESLVVTEHGRPVARLGPLPAGDDVLDQLAREGRLFPAGRRVDDVVPIGRKPDRRTSRNIMRALEEQRQERS